jgi:mRNA interferase RelE/StbE
MLSHELDLANLADNWLFTEIKNSLPLPEEIQIRIQKIVFEELETDNPFALGYLNKMKGYTDKYKIRVGDYRIGLTIKKSSQTMICQRGALRREIYRIFP